MKLCDDCGHPLTIHDVESLKTGRCQFCQGVASTRTTEVDVIQFMRPSGRQNPTSTILPFDLQDEYDRMRLAGCRFEAEVLSTGEVSVTIFDTHEEIDIAIAVLPNGPGVQPAMARMLAYNFAPTEQEKGVTHDGNGSH